MKVTLVAGLTILCTLSLAIATPLPQSLWPDRNEHNKLEKLLEVLIQGGEDRAALSAFSWQDQDETSVQVVDRAMKNQSTLKSLISTLLSVF